MTQRSATPHGATQRSATQRSATQRSATQRSATQRAFDLAFGHRGWVEQLALLLVISRRMLLVLDVMCVVGVGWAGVLIGGLLGGVRLVPSVVAVVVALVLVLPGFAAGVITNRRIVRGRHPQSGWVRSVWAPPELPRWGLVLTGLVFFVFWFAGISAIAGMSQDAPAGDSAVEESQQRFALGVLGGVGTGGTALAAASLLRGRKTRVDERVTAPATR